MNLQNNLKGITLIELLVVVAIIIILTGLTIPGFSGFAERKNFDTSVETFVSNLRSVQSKSQSGARPGNITDPYLPSEKWGIAFFCSSAGMPGSGAYQINYRYNNGTMTNIIESRSLNFDSISDAYRFSAVNGTACGGTFYEIYYDKFIGVATSSYGLFSSSDTATIQITSSTDNSVRTITVYKNGKIEIT